MQPIVSMKDYLRSWKLFTLFCGIGLLIIGSFKNMIGEIRLLLGVNGNLVLMVRTMQNWKILV